MSGRLTPLAEARAELERLGADMRRRETALEPTLAQLHPAHRRSGANLAHYLTLRQHDIRPLQRTLSELGLSSIGRAEEHVLDSLERVVAALAALEDLQPPGGAPPAPPAATAPRPPVDGEASALSRRQIDPAEGRRLLEANTDALLGHPPAGRVTRIMVTMPSEAATDDALVTGLLERGMDCARINCAHDDPTRWTAMVQNLRGGADRLGRHCPILADLPGPKLRTGPLVPGPRVLRIHPRRDALGRPVVPGNARLVTDTGDELPAAPGAAAVPVPGDWLSTLRPGDEVTLHDTRGSHRRLRVTTTEPGDGTAMVELDDTTYLAPGIPLVGPDGTAAPVGLLPAREQFLVLHLGDVLTVTADPAPVDPSLGRLRVGCTLPEAIAQVQTGQRVWFDDGRLGGIVVHTRHGEIDVVVTVAADGGTKLRAEKSINLPDTALHLPALSAADDPLLEFIAAQTDLVGLSFVQRRSDVALLQRRLHQLGADRLGIMLKIETSRGFSRLPELLFQAMATERVGVMVARGDLAVEVGFERLAELQEEILALCDAAHVPVVWATQVLDQMARTGQPSRAEISDAVLGHRTECIMLNKGPHILEAMTLLDDVLRRMGGHQAKKTPLLRQLQSWSA